MMKIKKLYFLPVLLLAVLSFAACTNSSDTDFRKGKTGKDASLATVKGFLYELDKNNDSEAKKYCSELFYQDNFVKEKNGEKAIGLTSVTEKSLKFKEKEQDQSYIVEASYSAKYTKAMPNYQENDTSHDLNSFFTVKKIKGEYLITAMADNEEDLKNAEPSDFVRTVSLKDPKVKDAKDAMDQFFEAFHKGKFSELEDCTLDEFFQDSVLGAKYKGECLGMYDAKVAQVSDEVTQQEGERFSFLVDVRAHVSKHSAFYLGNNKPVEFTTNITVVKVDGKYVVESLFEV